MDPELERRDVGVMRPMETRVQKPTADNDTDDKCIDGKILSGAPAPSPAVIAAEGGGAPRQRQYEHCGHRNDEHLGARENTETREQSAQPRIRLQEKERSERQRKRQSFGVGNRRGLEE